MDLAELLSKKRAAQKQYGNLPGILGFGVGDGTIRVYLQHPAAAGLLPQEFDGVRFEFVVAGEIEANASDTSGKSRS